MTVRRICAGDSTALLIGDVLIDCGVGITTAAAFSGESLAGVRHLLLTGTGPDCLDPALASAIPGTLRIHRPKAGSQVTTDAGVATAIEAEGDRCGWLLETPNGPILHAPTPPTATGRQSLEQYDEITVAGPTRSRILITGGSRSGKSQVAEDRLKNHNTILYVATGAVPDGSDAEWTRRIQAHRDRRPQHWATAETLDVAGVLDETGPAVLVDGIGTWLARAMDETGLWDGRDDADRALAERTTDLIEAWRRTKRDVVMVTDEVGSGVVPATTSGRRFRDELGRLNAALARTADEVWLVTAGIGQRLR
jgi:adenosylcobinamide kinase / adenosylcobinamide-phosphate guanylyltransferase